ncbi:hypothetical protein HJG60_008360 [Phyllostomus discolor]|uniref:Uncharacterized protein n=1 Tax=Phyllostomus discolor TaxID=89673 RepID=A0A833Z2U7_9CHIR|nr:hypothetical protein HJG60_008360 [Phyllostomus discolor]
MQPRDRCWLGGREAEAIAVGEFPKQCLSFHSFLLRNSSYSSLPLHTVANSPARLVTVGVRAHCMTQPHRCPQTLRMLTALVCLLATGFLPVLLRPCLAGEGAVAPAFSQGLCGKPGSGLWAWGCSTPGPHTGP